MLVTGVQMSWHVYVVLYSILGACCIEGGAACSHHDAFVGLSSSRVCAHVTGSSTRTGRRMWCPRRARRMQTQASASSAARIRSSSETVDGASIRITFERRRKRRRSFFRIVHARGAIPNEVGPARCRATPRRLIWE